MEQLKFLVEEYHRGEWQPFMIRVKGVKTQKYAKISQHTADRMNVYRHEYGLQYVLPKEQKTAEKAVQDSKPETLSPELELPELKRIYKDKFGKNAYHGWSKEVLIQKIEE